MNRNNSNETLESQLPDDDDSTMFNGASASSMPVDLGNIYSGAFTNITPIYTSPHGAAQLFTATRYGKRFVLKGLKEQYRADPVQLTALGKEFEIGMQLDHPNIRRTIGLETVAGLGQVIVLEYVDGCSLEEFKASERLTPASARAVAGQLAAALSYLHSKQVHHRDLKPSNILVAHQGGGVKIIDFSLSDADDFIILKSPAGTPRYMAPEQRVHGARPSPQADLYSFGRIVTELADLTADRPLAEAVRSCCDHDPKRRPASIDRITLPSAQLAASASSASPSIIHSKSFTYVLLAIAAALAGLIVFLTR